MRADLRTVNNDNISGAGHSEPTPKKIYVVSTSVEGQQHQTFSDL